MAGGETRRTGWFPLRGSWEESVLSWNEQVDSALRHRSRLGPRSQQGNLALQRSPEDISDDSVTAKQEASQEPLAS
ncbi:MAG: hypothetical protein GTN69_00575 [Armatimonadetes bacterium]|nr:hypothetical protein [Armatimonadota bacterium]NIM75732.1 hypothetical protein [Armatimonadota bacterium]NIN05396.1 hypothetical protein [Armatimonadota bacterium]NIO74403.1 hypothetical protein [Armatimonadota bacterium]NIO96510.1 hypothetical protein [Armatimonadota bacterium]